MKKVILFSCAIICSSFANATVDDSVDSSVFDIKNSISFACEKHEKSQECRKDLISKIKMASMLGKIYALCFAEGMNKNATDSKLCTNAANDAAFIKNLSADF